jgi:hypothetical protein
MNLNDLKNELNKDLNNDVNNEKNNNICLISKELIEHKITLNCNHSFDYYYLYQEIIQQKKRHSDYFKCPYCREMYEGTIPYYEIDDVEQISNVNYNTHTLNIHKCSWNNCSCPAHFYKTGYYCRSHYNLSNKKRCSAFCKNDNPCKHYALENGLCKKHQSIKNIQEIF